MATAAYRTRSHDGSLITSGWRWIMACGVLLVLAGMLVLAAPGFTTVGIAVLLGWVLLLAGVGGIVMGLRSHSAQRRWTDLLYGGASTLIGLLLLVFPVAGAATLALAVAFWLAFRGAVEIGGARVAGPGPLRGMLLLVGAVDWVLAFLLIANFPFPAVQMLGVFVGLSLLLGGAVTLLAAWQLRRLGLA
jgi:uncharacterized membrane protein HdeD (DUF308 family)